MSASPYTLSRAYTAAVNEINLGLIKVLEEGTDIEEFLDTNRPMVDSIFATREEKVLPSKVLNPVAFFFNFISHYSAALRGGVPLDRNWQQTMLAELNNFRVRHPNSDEVKHPERSAPNPQGGANPAPPPNPKSTPHAPVNPELLHDKQSSMDVDKPPKSPNLSAALVNLRVSSGDEGKTTKRKRESESAIKERVLPAPSSKTPKVVPAKRPKSPGPPNRKPKVDATGECYLPRCTNCEKRDLACKVRVGGKAIACVACAKAKRNCNFPGGGDNESDNEGDAPTPKKTNAAPKPSKVAPLPPPKPTDKSKGEKPVEPAVKRRKVIKSAEIVPDSDAIAPTPPAKIGPPTATRKVDVLINKRPVQVQKALPARVATPDIQPKSNRLNIVQSTSTEPAVESTPEKDISPARVADKPAPQKSAPQNVDHFESDRLPLRIPHPKRTAIVTMVSELMDRPKSPSIEDLCDVLHGVEEGVDVLKNRMEDIEQFLESIQEEREEEMHVLREIEDQLVTEKIRSKGAHQHIDRVLNEVRDNYRTLVSESSIQASKILAHNVQNKSFTKTLDETQADVRANEKVAKSYRQQVRKLQAASDSQAAKMGQLEVMAAENTALKLELQRQAETIANLESQVQQHAALFNRINELVQEGEQYHLERKRADADADMGKTHKLRNDDLDTESDVESKAPESDHDNAMDTENEGRPAENRSRDSSRGPSNEGSGHVSEDGETGVMGDGELVDGLEDNNNQLPTEVTGPSAEEENTDMDISDDAPGPQLQIIPPTPTPPTQHVPAPPTPTPVPTPVPTPAAIPGTQANMELPTGASSREASPVLAGPVTRNRARSGSNLNPPAVPVRNPDSRRGRGRGRVNSASRASKSPAPEASTLAPVEEASLGQGSPEEMVDFEPTP